jgi:hypothetical protein
MTISIGVNGFGRIGRLVTRAALEHPEANVVMVNDPFLTLEYAAYQLKYDSVHGVLSQDVSFEDGYLIVGDKKIRFVSERNPAGESSSVVSRRVFESLSRRSPHQTFRGVTPVLRLSASLLESLLPRKRLRHT